MKASLETERFGPEEFAVPDPPRIHKVVRFIRKHYGDLRGLKVLECGVARGGVADLLSREVAQCFGIDEYLRNIPGVTFVQADLNATWPALPYDFDIVFAGEIIEHIYDDANFLAQVKKVLKPNGLFIITTPNLVFSADRLRMLLGKMPTFAYRPYHYHIYNKSVLSKLFRDNGFKVLRIASSHVLFSRRRARIGIVFEWLGELFPTFGAHLIVYAVPEARP